VSHKQTADRPPVCVRGSSFVFVFVVTSHVWCRFLVLMSPRGSGASCRLAVLDAQGRVWCTVSQACLAWRELYVCQGVLMSLIWLHVPAAPTSPLQVPQC
jgi:hypothetical protein